MPKIIYPGAGKIQLDGGKNNKFEPSIIEDNESPDCLNVIFDNASVATREGSSKLTDTALGSFPIDGIYTRRDDTGAETMVVFAGSKVYGYETNTFNTIPSGTSVYTQGVRVAAAQYEGHLFVGQGNQAYKYNGTDYTRHGISIPSTQPVAATAATGTALTGDYRYKVTYVNSQSVEGDANTATATQTAASENIALTSIPVAPQSHGVASRRIYRTEAGGSTYKRLVEISDNTTTTYEDAIADGSLGVEPPTTSGEPPSYNAIVYHQNRLFVNDVANLNYIWYSNLGDPYNFAATNFIKIGDNSSDLVKGLGVMDNSLFVYCERSVWIVYMPDTTDSNWEVIRSRSPYGTKSPFSIVDYNNRQLFPAIQNDKFVGFAAMAGGTPEPSATFLTLSNAGSLLKSDRIEPDMFSVEEGSMDQVSGIVFKNRAYISVPYGSGQATNNRIYVMDFSIENLSKNQRETWAPWTGLSINQFTILDGKLYGGSSADDGFVYQLNDGTYNDSGSAINSYYVTKEYTGLPKHVSSNKDFRFINALLEMTGDWPMNVTYWVDSEAGSGNTVSVNLNPGGSLWGSMVWGSDTWGGGSDQEDNRIFLGRSNGERIKFKFTNQNTADQWFKVHWMNFTYNPKGRR